MVRLSDLVSEYPNTEVTAPLTAPLIQTDHVPKPKVYSPYNTSDNEIKTCYLDRDKSIPAPDIYAYDGLPQHMPNAVLGSYEIFGIRDDICFD